jgi:hypothetical protein
MNGNITKLSMISTRITVRSAKSDQPLPTLYWHFIFGSPLLFLDAQRRFDAMVMDYRQQADHEKLTSVIRRRILASYWLVVLLAIPLWWWATSIERLSLPENSIRDISKQEVL